MSSIAPCSIIWLSDRMFSLFRVVIIHSNATKGTRHYKKIDSLVRRC